MDTRQRGSWWWLLVLILGGAGVALGVAWILVLVAEVNGSGSTANQNAFGHLTAVLVLLLFTLGVRALGGTPRGFVMGKDNRVSTSKVQVVIWTYALAGAALSLIAATWVGPDTGFDNLFDSDFDFEPYLVLLGGPFAAAVAARAIVGSQVASGQAIKPPGEPSASQIFTNDSGQGDLVDAQYLLFNLVALVYFFGAFLESPSSGLPDIPTILYALTGAAAAGYIANKAVATGPPRVNALVPARGPVDTEVEIFGTGLLVPKEEGATVENASPPTFHAVRVMIGDLDARLVAESLIHLASGDDRLKAIVPDTLTPDRYDVKVLNFRGTPSEPKQFEVTL
jgi:hypothetical protein